MRQLKINPSITNRKDDSIENYLNSINKIKMITPDEEAELARKIHLGDQDALHKLVSANLRFVVSVAKQYQNRGLSLADMICEGNIGLMNAARKFDETLGYKFISFAVFDIRQSIQNAISRQTRMVRIPDNQILLLGRIRKIQNRYEQEENRPATIDEIADELEIEPEKIKTTLLANTKSDSLDAPIGDEDFSLLDLTAGSEEDDADNPINIESLHQDLDTVINSILKPREISIIRDSFGFGRVQKSMEEISDSLGLTRERVRQIRERALIKLRKNPSCVSLLKGYN